MTFNNSNCEHNIYEFMGIHKTNYTLFIYLKQTSYRYVINSQSKLGKEEAQGLRSLRATKGFRRVSNMTNTHIRLPQLKYCKNLLGLVS